MSADKPTYKYAIKLEYIGKNYAGSQIQRVEKGKTQPLTIQAEVEKALCTLILTKSQKQEIDINTRPIKTIFSGRTDKGVNAKGQIVHFECYKPIVASMFIHSINAILPDDISVSELKEVEERFHAQKSAKKRHYQYVFLNKKIRSAFDGDLMLVREDLNIKRMKNALEHLKGEHDFSSFKSSGSENPYTDCLIYDVECKKLNDTVVIDIVGNRFLYNMVRTIVGTLLMIEKNDLDADVMKIILESKDRSKAGKTVNPKGLTLVKVEY